MPTQPSPSLTLRLGARGSLLSRMQSQWVADQIEKIHPAVKVELVLIKTTGDQIADRPLHEAGGKGLFTKELEQALLDERIDFAVHSFKDVPVTMPLVAQDNLVFAAVPRREDPRDVLASPVARSIADLPPGTKVGTGSLRRRCQLLAARPDLAVDLIRGNVDTRIKKLKSGEYGAVILAMAGLRRSGLFDQSIMEPIAPEQMLPAAGQGALAIQCRRDDPRVRELLSAMNSPDDFACVDLERSLVRELEGDCHSPIAAWATIQGETIGLRAAVGRRDGGPPVIQATASAPAGQPGAALEAVIGELESQGVRGMLRG